MRKKAKTFFENVLTVNFSRIPQFGSSHGRKFSGNPHSSCTPSTLWLVWDVEWKEFIKRNWNYLFNDSTCKPTVDIYFMYAANYYNLAFRSGHEYVHLCRYTLQSTIINEMNRNKCRHLHHKNISLSDAVSFVYWKWHSLVFLAAYHMLEAAVCHRLSSVVTFDCEWMLI